MFQLQASHSDNFTGQLWPEAYNVSGGQKTAHPKCQKIEINTYIKNKTVLKLDPCRKK